VKGLPLWQSHPRWNRYGSCVPSDADCGQGLDRERATYFDDEVAHAHFACTIPAECLSQPGSQQASIPPLTPLHHGMPATKPASYLCTVAPRVHHHSRQLARSDWPEGPIGAAAALSPFPANCPPICEARCERARWSVGQAAMPRCLLPSRAQSSVRFSLHGCCAVMGASGAGKTTPLDALVSCLHRPMALCPVPVQKML
jgi:hypothetical protein